MILQVLSQIFEALVTNQSQVQRWYFGDPNKFNNAAKLLG